MTSFTKLYSELNLQLNMRSGLINIIVKIGLKAVVDSAWTTDFVSMLYDIEQR